MKRKFLYNSIASLVLQFVSIFTGLLTSRLILEAFGSETNGMLQSISQFLNYSGILEAGAGGVINVAFYKAIAKESHYEINGVMNASRRFFRQLGVFIFSYTLLLAVVFPVVTESSYSTGTVGVLVLLLGGLAVVQTAMGRPYQMFLGVECRGYVNSILRIGVLLLNACAIYTMVTADCTIAQVKLVSCFTYGLLPLGIHLYVKKTYTFLDPSVPPNNKALKERWNALGQHLAGFVHGNIDIVLLTFFQGFEVVSVYAVYKLVISGLSGFVGSAVGSFGPMVGRALAQENKDKANWLLNQYECLIFLSCSILYSCCALLIIPFISLYTQGIDDINYIYYPFAFVISLYGFCNVVRGVYYGTIFSAGHFKQTSGSSYVEMILNLVLSVLFVQIGGLVGIVSATIVSVLYKTIVCVLYLEKNIVFRSRNLFLKHYTISAILFAVDYQLFQYTVGTVTLSHWGQWIALGIVVFLAVALFHSLVFFLCYRPVVASLWETIPARFRLKK